MNSKNKKGGSDVRVTDMIELLEYKIISNEYSDREYGLYIKVKQYENELIDNTYKELKLRLSYWYKRASKDVY